MFLRPTQLALALAAAGLVALGGCGGGGGGDAVPSPSPTSSSAAADPAPAPDAPSAVGLSGTVATGAPLAGAALKVVDATGATVCETVVAADGGYACDLGTAPKAPFVIVAERDGDRLVSVAAAAAGGTANVTPITHLVAARLASNGDPLSLVEDVRTSPGAVTPAAVDAAVGAVMTALRPLADAVGANGDPIRTRFAVDGTGHDRLLDTIQVSVRPTGTESNVEITVRTRPGTEDAPPVSLSFTTRDAAIPALSASTVNPATIGGDNIAALIVDLLSRTEACYALPRAQRVTDGSNPGSAVAAPQCRGLFVGDDPTTFLSNGMRVGPQGAFKGMFGPGGGVRFDRGTFEFRRADGDYVISYRWTAPDGSTDNDSIVARREGSVLKFYGNQYAYDARVRPIAQHRDLVRSPQWSSIATGYNMWIANVVDGGGQPIFDRAVVTTPRGTQLTFRPTPGLSQLALARPDGSLSGSGVLWLNGRFLDPASPGHPRERESSMLFANPADWSDDAIRAIPDQSVWRVEFVHADPSVPNVVQTYRTISRAQTLAETARTSFAGITAAARAGLIEAAGDRAGILFEAAGSLAEPNQADLGSPADPFWSVPAGAVAPTWIGVFGRAPSVGATLGARFTDGVTVPSARRHALVRCSRQSLADTHCDPTYQDQYAQGSMVFALELWGRNARQVELSKLVGVYRP
jgi:hypothetical protein